MTNEEFQKAVLQELNNLKGQLSETNSIVKAVLHRTDELDAKYDGLLHTTATKEAIAQIEAKLDNCATKEDIDRLAGDVTYLVRKAAEHEDDIRALRRAK